MTSSRLARGYSERISSGPTTLTVRPKTLAIEALRCSSSMRPAGGRHGYGATLAIACSLTRLGLKSAIQVTRVARQLCHVDAMAQLADEARRVPGRAARQLFYARRERCRSSPFLLRW